jgi:hypothetical protein
MKKLNILSTGVLANDPLIEWGAENLAASTVHQSFDANWVIVTHNEDRADKCVHQARTAPMDVTVMIDEESRTDRTSATRRALLEIPSGEYVWMFPEGLIPCTQAGVNIRSSLEKDDSIAYEGVKCDGLDHIVFKRPQDDVLASNKSMLSFFSNVRKKGRHASADEVIITRGASTDLQRLSVIYWTLKYHQHHYTDVYETLLQPYRSSSISLLEIGVAQGASLRTFRDFLHKGNIFGLDIYPESVLKEPRVKVLIGDSTEKDTADELCSMNKNKPFDVIIDDGSHYAEHQVSTFERFWPHVAKGGMYLIEDIWGESILESGIRKLFPKIVIEKFDLRQKSGYGDSMIFLMRKN